MNEVKAVLGAAKPMDIVAYVQDSVLCVRYLGKPLERAVPEPEFVTGETLLFHLEDPMYWDALLGYISAVFPGIREKALAATARNCTLCIFPLLRSIK